MPIIVRIAFRNLRQHRSKTLIIGIIITLGVMIIVLGNSLMDTASLGIERAFIDNYTGHVFISAKAEGDVSLFGVQSAGGIEETPGLPEYEKIRKYLESQDEVEGITTQITGFAGIRSESQEDIDAMAGSLLFGINPAEYPDVFDNLTILEGEYLTAGEPGIILSKTTVEDIKEKLGIDLRIGDPLLLNGFGTTGFHIREVPLKGIFDFKQESEAADLISYIDAQTLRALKGMNLGGGEEVSLTEEETGLLEAGNNSDYESLFSDEVLFAENETAGEEITKDIYSILQSDETADTEETVEIPLSDTPENGSWEYILITLKRPGAAGRFIRETNTWFEENNLAAQAGGWKKAAGPFSKSADTIRIVFNVAVVLVVIVAIIIIINTLVINVVERTGEIGTMRALGAQRPFIRRLFNMEITAISLVFGIIGLGAGILALLIIRLIGFEAGNPFVEILFAGKVLRPVINPSSLFFTLIGAILFGILVNLWPLRLALKVQPVKAMQTE